MKTSDFQQLIKHIIRHDSKHATVKVMSPRRDWMIGIAIGAVLLAVSFLFSVYSYVTYRYDEMSLMNTEPVTIPAYKAAVVAAALSYIDERDEQFASAYTPTQPVNIPIADISTPSSSSEETMVGEQATTSPVQATSTPQATFVRPPFPASSTEGVILDSAPVLAE